MFSPFSIVGMVVHMLDPAVWEVNGVGSHLSNEILTIGLTHILIVIVIVWEVNRVGSHLSNEIGLTYILITAIALSSCIAKLPSFQFLPFMP